MTAQRRKQIAIVLFALDVLVCGIWVYREAKLILDALAAGTGGVAGVSAGYLVILYTVAPLIITIALARAVATRLARYWRNAHLVVLFLLIVMPMMGGLRLILVSIAVFLPAQVFFVIGALAVWIASARTQLLTSES